MRTFFFVIIFSVLALTSLFGQRAVTTETWTIDSVSVPECDLCKELGLKLNKLLNQEIEVGYKLIFSSNDLVIVDNNSDTLISRDYKFKDDIIETWDFDTYDSVELLTKTDSQMILRDYQRVVKSSGDTSPPNELLVYLTKE